MAREPVVAMAYDGTSDAAQQIFTVPLSFGDFLEWSRDLPRDVLDALPYGEDTVLYLLVTDRHAFDAGATGTLADPNGEGVSSGGPLAAFLRSASDVASPVVDGAGPFDVAWTSVRLGSAYAYPTHVDCYENVLFQLAGSKNVTVFPPDAVWDLRPDVNAKHWPRGDAADLARARRLAKTVELREGDALYVPLMWPHNVDADDFSVTSNKYLFLKDDFHDYIDRSKNNAFLAYETVAGVRLC